MEINVYGYRAHIVDKQIIVKYNGRVVFHLKDTPWFNHAENKSYPTVQKKNVYRNSHFCSPIYGNESNLQVRAMFIV